MNRKGENRMPQSNIPTNPLSEVRARWVVGKKSEAWVRGHGPLIIDEPAFFGGNDTGPRSTEYLLVGYIGCSMTVLRGIADRMDFAYSKLDMEAKGEVTLPDPFDSSCSTVAGFSWVDATIRMTTSESTERVETLKQALERRCVVSNILIRSGARLNLKWEVTSA